MGLLDVTLVYMRALPEKPIYERTKKTGPHEEPIRTFHIYSAARACIFSVTNLHLLVANLHHFRVATHSGSAPLMATSPHPHFEYPQFKQVAHPSISTSALVEHLWHMVAVGGKLAPSPVTSMSSSWPLPVAAVITPPS